MSSALLHANRFYPMLAAVLTCLLLLHTAAMYVDSNAWFYQRLHHTRLRL
jgi:hypothetical protein